MSVADITASHDYGLTWTPDYVEWSLDGHPYGRLYKHEYTNPNQWWAYDDPQFLILNLALGGDWPKDPNPDFKEAEMVVESATYQPLDMGKYHLFRQTDPELSRALLHTQ